MQIAKLKPSNLVTLSLVCEALLDLSDIYVAAGDQVSAEAACQSALQMTEKKYGPESPLLVPILRNLGEAQLLKKSKVDATKTFERELELQEKVVGKNSRYLRKSLLQVMTAHMFTNNYPELEKTLKRLIEMEGRNSKQSAIHAQHLAYCLLSEGKAKEALEYALLSEKLIDDYGSSGPRWIYRSRSFEAASYYRLGDKAKAAKIINDIRTQAKVDVPDYLPMLLQLSQELAICQIWEPSLEITKYADAQVQQSKNMSLQERYEALSYLAGTYSRLKVNDRRNELNEQRAKLREQMKHVQNPGS